MLAACSKLGNAAGHGGTVPHAEYGVAPRVRPARGPYNQERPPSTATGPRHRHSTTRADGLCRVPRRDAISPWPFAETLDGRTYGEALPTPGRSGCSHA